MGFAVTGNCFHLLKVDDDSNLERGGSIRIFHMKLTVMSRVSFRYIIHRGLK